MTDDQKKREEIEEETGEKGGKATSDMDYEPDTGFEDYERDE